MILACIHKLATGQIRRILQVPDMAQAWANVQDGESVAPCPAGTDPQTQAMDPETGAILPRPRLGVTVLPNGFRLAQAPAGMLMSADGAGVSDRFSVTAATVVFAVEGACDLILVPPFPWQSVALRLDITLAEVPADAQVIAPPFGDARGQFAAALAREIDALETGFLGPADDRQARLLEAAKGMAARAPGGQPAPADLARLRAMAAYSDEAPADLLARLQARAEFADWLGFRVAGLREAVQDRIASAASLSDLAAAQDFARSEGLVIQAEATALSQDLAPGRRL